MVDTNFPEITVNTTVAGDQTNPRVLQNKDGVVCVIWETTRELVDADGLTQSFSAIQAQLFAIDGSRIGGEIWVTGTEERLLYTDTTINLHRMQLLQRYSDGAFVITWFSSNDLSLSTQILSATGTLIGDVNRIHIETGNAKPTVTARVHLRALTDGGFIAAWSSDDHPTGLTGSSRDVYCARFDDDFVAVGGLAKVFGTLGQVTGDEDVVGLTELSNGGFALAINAQRTPVTNTTSLGVYIATYDSDMTFRGNYHFIPTTSTLNNSITVMRPMYPLATSGFVVIGFSPNGLHAFDDQGILTGTHASPAGHSRTGGFASIASDRVIIPQSTASAIANVFAADFSSVIPEVDMAVYSDLQEQYPYVCAAIDGGFIAVWQSNTELDTQDNDGFAIMMRRFDVNGSSVDFAEAYEGDYIPVGGQVGTDTDTGGDGSDDGSGDGSGGDSGGCVTTCSESDGKHLTIKISVPVCCC